MNVIRIAIVSALSLLAATARAEPVMESFERMLSHTPSSAPVARPAEPADPLVAAVVVPLREDGSASVLVHAVQDAALASFDRMFHHQPTYTHPSAPSGIDPLLTAIVDLVGDVHAEPVRLADAISTH